MMKRRAALTAPLAARMGHAKIRRPLLDEYRGVLGVFVL
jgi:hypothetical protein